MAAAGSAIHEDVTAQRLHERVLLRTERFLATVIENTSEGIIAKDARNLRYVFVNNAAEETIGKPRGEIVGKTAPAVCRRDRQSDRATRSPADRAQAAARSDRRHDQQPSQRGVHGGGASASDWRSRR
jgi:PAS domain-containing protein